MSLCRHCGQRLQPRDAFCPECMGAQERPVPGRWEAPGRRAESLRVIARFMSAAEAGFFADELARSTDFHPVLAVEEQYDAVGGRWMSRFALSVAEDQAERAVLSLRDLVAEHEQEPEPTVNQSPRLEEEQLGINWVPIILTLAAGSAAFLYARKPAEPPPEQRDRPPQRELLEQLSAEPGRWRQTLEGGRTREFWFEADRRTAIVREMMQDREIIRREFPLQIPLLAE